MDCGGSLKDLGSKLDLKANHLFDQIYFLGRVRRVNDAQKLSGPALFENSLAVGESLEAMESVGTTHATFAHATKWKVRVYHMNNSIIET